MRKFFNLFGVSSFLICVLNSSVNNVNISQNKISMDMISLSSLHCSDVSSLKNNFNLMNFPLCNRLKIWLVKVSLRFILNVSGFLTKFVTGGQESQFLWLGNIQMISYISFYITKGPLASIDFNNWIKYFILFFIYNFIKSGVASFTVTTNININ